MYDQPSAAATTAHTSTHTVNSSALDGYLQLAKQTSGNELVMIIKQVLKDPQIYLFSSLLSLPSVQQLQQSSDAVQQQYYQLLSMFTYSTYDDYLQRKNQLPQLSPTEARKLQQLTVITIANSSTSNSIPYSMLMSAVHINSIRQLEDLLIDTMYENLLVGSLDQRSQQLTAVSAIARDINLHQQLSPLFATIQQWSTHTQQNVLPFIKQQQAWHQQDADNEQFANAQFNVARHEKIKQLRESTGKKGGGADSNDAAATAGSSSALHKRAASSLKKITQVLRR